MTFLSRRCLLGVLAAGLLISQQGCIFLVVGAAAGAVATAHYADGILRTNEGKAMPEVWEATLAAVQEDLKYPVTKADESPTECILNAAGPEGAKVKLWLVPFSDNVTDLRIQVGLLGDEAISRDILAKIRARY